MDGLEMLRYLTRRAYGWLDANVAGVSHEQANWQPPGTANSIAATYAHAIISADVDLNRRFHERESLIAGAWGARLGLGESFSDEWKPNGDIDWRTLCTYGDDVRARVERLVDSLTYGDLERVFEMKYFVRDENGTLVDASLGPWQGIDVYTLHGFNHITMHGGEIACLKGLQGLQGYQKFTSLYSTELEARS
jgi:hypothetical protein